MSKLKFGYILITLILLYLFVSELYEDQIPPTFFMQDLPMLLRINLVAGPISACALLFWMIIDAWSDKGLRNRGWWLLALIVFNWVANIVYFIDIYRKKYKHPARDKITTHCT
jgi:hypothetical protein